MKGKIKLVIVSFLLLFALIGCNNASSTTTTTTSATTTTTSATTTTTSATTATTATTSTTTTTTSATTTTTASPYLMNYDWESSEWNGEQAFSDGEGDNFMIQDGYANTINDQGVIGPTSVWSFGYTPYDMAIGECTVEAKVQYVESLNADEVAVFSIRHLYSLHYDLQLFFQNGDVYSGVRFYNSPTNVLGDSTDVSKGGQLSGQEFVAGQDYVIKLIYDYTGETTTDVYVYVNDILEIYLTGVTIQSENAKFGIGASPHTSLKVDYLRAYDTDPADITTPTLANVTLAQGWEFNEDSGTAGSTILGDSYVEGESFAADGNGYLRSLADGSGTFGPVTGWTSARTGYDMNIPTNYILEYKVRANSVTGQDSGMACVRPSYAIYCDFQFVMSSVTDGAGFYVYKQGSEWSSVSGLNYVLDHDYLVDIVFEQTSTDTTNSDYGVYQITIFVDGVQVLQIQDGESAGPSASFALCTNTNSDISFDFFRIYGFD